MLFSTLSVQRSYKQGQLAVAVRDKRLSIFLRGKSILSSEMILHKDCERKGSVEKISGRDPEGA
jgi:hypothetical protein